MSLAHGAEVWRKKLGAQTAEHLTKLIHNFNKTKTNMRIFIHTSCTRVCVCVCVCVCECVSVYECMSVCVCV